MSLEIFRTKVRTYLRAINVAQPALARELGLHQSVLSHKLNAKDGSRLTQPEVKKIVKFLAQADAITTRREAVELLEAMDLKAVSFGVAEWQALPLNKLETESEMAAKVEQVAIKVGVAGQSSFSTNATTSNLPATPQQQISPEPAFADNPSTPLHNFPAQPTPLIGREHEIIEARNILRRADVRMLTLIGTGGIGKTRLAYQLAMDLLPDFQNGAWLVSLVAVSDPNLVVTVIAATLGVKETPGDTAQTLTQNLKNYLRNRQILLLLDNFEQLVTAAPLLGELLEAAPRLKLLVTSRGVLQVYGEHKFEVPPLSLPDATVGIAGLPSLDILSRYDAIALFVQRARAAKANFLLNANNAPSIVEICTRLDGLPLAIELAAAWLRMLTPSELLTRLLDKNKQVTHIKLLMGGATNLPTHKQTLHNTLEWSYQLLETDAERSLFQRLGIFVGGCSWEAIQTVCFESVAEADPSEEILLDGVINLAALLDKSMLRRVELVNQADNSVETRFMMLETIREYALDKLRDSQEIDLLRHRHAEYYLKFAELAEPKLHGAEQRQWLNRLNFDYANLRSILDWLLVLPLENEWATQAVLRLGNNLVTFWAMRDYYREGFQWMNKAIVRASSTPDLLTNPVLVGLLARLLTKAGNFLSQLNQFEQALPLMEQSVALARKLSDKKILLFSLCGTGELLAMMNLTTKAIAFFEESLQLLEEVPEPRYEMIVLNGLGVAAEVQGHYKEAVQYFERCVTLTTKLNLTFATQVSLFNLGQAHLLDGQYNEARTTFNNCITSCLASGNRSEIFLSLYGLAGLAGAPQQAFQNLTRAAKLVGAAETFGKTFSLLQNDADRTLIEPLLKIAQSQLDPTLWQQALHEGHAMTPDQIIAFALKNS